MKWFALLLIIAAFTTIAVFGGGLNLNEGGAFTTEPDSGTSSPEPSNDSDLKDIHSQYEKPRQMRVNWIESQRIAAAKFGLDFGKAAFRIIRPGKDPFFKSAATYSDLGYSRFFYFFESKRKYLTQVYHAGVDKTPTFAGETVWVDCDKILAENGFSSMISVLDQVTGTYRIDAHLSSGGFQFLKDIYEIRRSSSQEYNDWFGIQQPAGGLPTELSFALSWNGRVYYPIDYSTVSTSGSSGSTFMIADNLSQTESQTIMASFGF